MQYQLVLKADDRDDAREMVSDYTGSEHLVSLSPLHDRWVAIIDVDFDAYFVSSWEGALNHIMNQPQYGLVWWSRVGYCREAS